MQLFRPVLWQTSRRILAFIFYGSIAIHADDAHRTVVRWDEMRVVTQVHAPGVAPIKSATLLGPELKDGSRQASIDLHPAGTMTVTVKTAPDSDGNIRVETTGVVTAAAATRLTVDKLSLEIPLSLSNRKRVTQAGEQNLVWETRSVYQLHAEEQGTQLLPEPDTNIWSVFRSDWGAGDTYSLQRWESDRTAPYVLHRGRTFPGWMAVYDRTGGVVIAVDEPAYTTPRSLEVRTDGGGVACLDLQPISADPTSAQPGHTVRYDSHWVLRTFEGDLVDNGVRLARTPPPPEPLTAEKTNPSTMLPVFGGVPVAQGLLQAGDHIQLTNAEGHHVQVQSTPLAYWPDGSIKWTDLVFFERTSPDASPVQTSSADASLTGFEVNDGTGRKDRYTLSRTATGPARESNPHSPMTVDEHNGVVRVRTGRMEAVFANGENWWRTLAVDGRDLLSKHASVSAYLDMIESDIAPEPDARRVAQTEPNERTSLVAEKVSVEEHGLIRTVIKIDGHTNGRSPCLITLRLEFYADSPAIRGYYTLQLGDFDVRKVFITGFGLELPLALDPSRAKVTVAAANPVSVPARDRVALRSLHPDLIELRAGPDDDTRTVMASPNLDGMINVQEAGTGFTAGIRDFRKMFPTQIVTAPRAGGLTLDLAFWPHSAGVMDFRRYSNFPHLAQGETITRVKNDWADVVYYAQEPARGISITQEFLLVPGILSGDSELGALNAALNDRALPYAGEAAYLKAGALIDDLSAPTFAPATEMLNRFADFLEFHRKRWRWFGKWIYGDIQHSFMRGYGRIVKPDALADLLAQGWAPPAKGKEWAGPVTNGQLTKSMTVRDYRAANDWSADNGRWGWGNTEGLPNRYLSELYLRTGRRDVFFAMESLARHSRDVVIRHEGRWFGSGTRHGVQPWSDGGHQERQTIPSEYRVHRLLTGDKRSRDVLLRYGYEVFLTPKSTYVQGAAPLVRDSVDHCTRLYGLLALWEATGDPAVGEALSRYVKLFIDPQGIMTEPTVRFPQIEAAAPPRGLNAGTMFFNTFGAMYALNEYYSITHDDALRQALCKMASAALDTPRSRAILETDELNSSAFYWPALAFAARHADEPRRFRDFLQAWLAGPGATAVRAIVSSDRSHWTGPTSFIHTNMPEALFWLNTLPSVVAGLGEVPAASPAGQTAIDNLEQNGIPRPTFPLSWQDEYDRPEFSGYLGPWLPWKTIP